MTRAASLPRRRHRRWPLMASAGEHGFAKSVWAVGVPALEGWAFVCKAFGRVGSAAAARWVSMRKVLWRVGVPVLAGWLSVAGPWGLHLAVERSCRRRVTRMLERRTGGRVTLRRVRPRGLLGAGLLVEELEVRFEPRFGVQRLRVPRMTIRLRPSGDGIVLVTAERPTFNASASVDQMRRLIRRVLGPRRSSSRGALRRVYRVKVDSGSVSLSFTGGPVARVRAARFGVDFGPCRNGRAGRCVVFRLDHFLAVGRDDSWLSLRRLDLVGRVEPRAPGPNEKGWVSRSLRSLGALHIQRFAATGFEAGLSGGPSHSATTVTAQRARISGSLKAVTLAEELLEVRALVHSPVRGFAPAILYGYADGRRGRVTVTARLDRFPIGAFLGDQGPIKARRTLLSGRITAEAGSEGWIELKGKAAVQTDLRIDHRALAAGPIRWRSVKAYLEGTGRADGKGVKVELRRAAVAAGRMVAEVKLKAIHRAGRIRGELVAGLRAGRCQDLLDSLPQGLVPALEGMRLEGRWGGQVTVSVKSGRLEDLQLQVRSFGSGCRVTADPVKADVHRLSGSYSVTVPDRFGNPSRWMLGPSNPDYRRLAQLPSHLVAAFLTAEDRAFFRHRGFDLDQIRPALVFDLKHRGFYKGASSISQQLVKNVFLSHRRDISRKLQEAILTWRLEQVVPKRRILELYLNVIELGPGIYGVRQASRTYFAREPYQLTPMQSLHLAAITPSPRRYYRMFKGGRVTMAWLLKLRFLLRRMYRAGSLSREKYNTLMRSPLIIAAF